MILDLLSFDWSDIPTILGRTKGVLEQSLINKKDGLFVWARYGVRQRIEVMDSLPHVD